MYQTPWQCSYILSNRYLYQVLWYFWYFWGVAFSYGYLWRWLFSVKITLSNKLLKHKNVDFPRAALKDYIGVLNVMSHYLQIYFCIEVDHFPKHEFRLNLACSHCFPFSSASYENKLKATCIHPFPWSWIQGQIAEGKIVSTRMSSSFIYLDIDYLN